MPFLQLKTLSPRISVAAGRIRDMPGIIQNVKNSMQRCCQMTPGRNLEHLLLRSVFQFHISELLRGVGYILTTRNHIAMWGRKCFPEAVLYTEAP
ncbi:hypothetical protein TNCV_3417571 [Trichonephila clavipes]|nr:hypothetical protein TNCV_3417571 [Trichonephila clavipes]